MGAEKSKSTRPADCEVQEQAESLELFTGNIDVDWDRTQPLRWKRYATPPDECCQALENRKTREGGKENVDDIEIELRI